MGSTAKAGLRYIPAAARRASEWMSFTLGTISGAGAYVVDGSASVCPPVDLSTPAGEMKVAADIRSFGRRNLFVQQLGMHRNPSFDFRPLTAQFLYNAIEFDAEFDFSLRCERIGDVTYVSGAGARDYGGDVTQGMVSLNVTGGWRKEGLAIALQGDLGDRTAFMNKPVRSEYRKERYLVDIVISWMVLRFVFYAEKGFVIDNHRKYFLGDR